MPQGQIYVLGISGLVEVSILRSSTSRKAIQDIIALMASFFKSSFKKSAPPLPRTPENMRIYVVGDIHGRFDLLKDLHFRMLEDAQKVQDARNNMIIFLGDYIDRGPASKDVIEAMIGFSKENHYIFLKGNHEVTLLNFLDDPEILGKWRSYGGRELLASYGVNLETIQAGFKGVQTEFIQKLPENHLHFYQNLQTSVTLGDYFFVHAGIRPGILPEKQSEKDMLWIREEFLNSQVQHHKYIIHGHTPVKEPEILPNRLNIDTGAYKTGKLTCLVLEDAYQRFL